MDSTGKNEILAVEEKLKLAMLSSDVDALDELLSPGLIFTNHLGQVISKQNDLEAHRKGDFKINKLSLSDQVMKFSGEVAIVSVLTNISGSYKGQPTSANFRFTRVWGKESGAWQISAGHSSLVA